MPAVTFEQRAVDWDQCYRVELQPVGEGETTTIPHHIDHGYLHSLDGRRFVSWWDMLQIDTRSFLSSLTFISSFLGEHRGLLSLSTKAVSFRATLSLEQRADVLRAILNLQAECAKHGLKTSDKLSKNAHDACLRALAGEHWYHPNNLQTVIVALEGLMNATVSEAESRQFYVLDRNVDEKHDDADALFGADVVDAFPKAEFDISEAGKCLSFGLWTASAMHTMKVLEIGLNGLAQHVRIEASENWNKTLNEIEAALRAVSKRMDGPEAEQWAAEAGTHLRFIKNAFRNELAHAGSKCDEREARAIFQNARSFMAHIAERTKQAR